MAIYLVDPFRATEFFSHAQLLYSRGPINRLLCVKSFNIPFSKYLMDCRSQSISDFKGRYNDESLEQ